MRCLRRLVVPFVLLLVLCSATFPAAAQNRGLWISDAELSALPTNTPAWQYVKATADTATYDSPALTTRNSHNCQVLAAAIVAARLNSDTYRQKVRTELARTMAAPINTSDVLAACRRLGTYALAVDIAGLDRAPYREWFRAELRRKYSGGGPGGSIIDQHEIRPQNFGTHAFASRVAVDLLIDDRTDLERAVRVHKAFVGQEGTWNWRWYGGTTWHASPNAYQPAINPIGATINGVNVSGVLVDDIQRGGDFHWPLSAAFKTGDGAMYSWEALQGLSVGTVLLCRNGYPDARYWGSGALLRCWQWLIHVGGMPMMYDNAFQRDLATYLYAADGEFVTIPAGIKQDRVGKSMAFTHYTHRGRTFQAAPAPPPDPPPVEPEPEPEPDPDPDPPPPPPVDDCAELRAELERVKVELAAVRQNLAAAIVSQNALAAERDAAKQDAAAARSELTTARNELAAAQIRAIQLQAEADRLLRKIAAAQEGISAAQEALR